MALYGTDQSEYQDVGNYPGNFVLIRATYGVPDNASQNYVDKNCDAHYQAAKSQGKLRGVYHFAYPKLNSAVAEANYFVDNIQGYLGDAVLALDYETNLDVMWALAWLNQVYFRTQVRPFIYMSASVCTAADWSPVYNAGYALWAAGYPSEFDVADPPVPLANGIDMPYNTGAWPFATIWQYSSSAGALDRDIFYGTPDAWNRFAEGDRNVPPSPATQDTPTTPATPANPTPAEPPVQPTPAPVPQNPQPPTGAPTNATTPPVIHVPAPVEAPTQAPVGQTETLAMSFWQRVINWLKGRLWKR
jgi:lysozyme